MIECVVPRRTNDRQTYLVVRSREAAWVSRTRNGSALLRRETERSVWSGSTITASHSIDGLFEPRFRPSGVRAFSRLAGVRPFLRADGH